MKQIENSEFVVSPWGMGCWVTRVGFPSSYKTGEWGDTVSEKWMRDIHCASDLGISVSEVSNINAVNNKKAAKNDVNIKRSNSCCKLPQCAQVCE